MKQLSILLLCCFLLTACHKHDDDVEMADLSVLVYIAGDNNLNSFINYDIRQIIEGSQQLSNRQNLILFIDRKGIPPYFLKVASGDTTRLYTCPEELKSSKPATLKMALQWVKDNYEAKQYGLSLWGHADGWTIKDTPAGSNSRRAYGLDVTNGSTWMEIPDMARVLDEMCADKPLRFIFADCCCFQNIEVAYELRHCTDYIIASPAEIPGEGAPYHTVIPALFSSRDDFYQQAVDAYYAQTSYEGYQEPMSVVKTEKLEDLALVTRSAFIQCLEPLNNEGTNYPDVDQLIYYYNHCHYDMNDFMMRNTSPEVYAQWKQTFDNTVIYKKMSPVWLSSGGYSYYDAHVPYTDRSQSEFRDFTMTEERYGGISMYVPQSTIEMTTRDRTFQQEQSKTINLMQWYKAAGLDTFRW